MFSFAKKKKTLVVQPILWFHNHTEHSSEQYFLYNRKLRRKMWFDVLGGLLSTQVSQILLSALMSLHPTSMSTIFKLDTSGGEKELTSAGSEVEEF